MKFEAVYTVSCLLFLSVFISQNECENLTTVEQATESASLNATTDLATNGEETNATTAEVVTTFSPNSTNMTSVTSAASSSEQTPVNQTTGTQINETKSTDFIINVNKVTPPGADWNEDTKKESESWLDEGLMKTLYLPVICGVGGAVLIVLLFSIAKCMRRRRKRRIKVTKKVPPAMKSSRQNDRMMLLAESSDEEF